MTTDTVPLHPKQADTPPTALWIAGVVGLVAAWFAIYSQLEPFAAWLASLLPLESGSHLEAAVQFFIYDTPKVLMLLTLVVFAMRLQLGADTLFASVTLRSARTLGLAPGVSCFAIVKSMSVARDQVGVTEGAD